MSEGRDKIIYLYILIYGLLLCFVRFSGVNSAAYMPIFSLFEDPTYFPNDMYVHNSIIASTSYLYPLLKIFGKLPSNTYFIFFLYIIASLTHIYFIFKIARALFPDLKEYNVGLIVLLLFLYDYPIFTITSQLVYQHTFSQTVVAMPILAAALYYYFKNKLLLSVFLIAIIAMPLHLKSSWFILIMVLVYLLFSFKRIQFNRVAIIGFFVFISALIIILYRSQSVGSTLAYAQRLELCNGIILRERGKIDMFANCWTDFLKFFFIFCGGVWSVRFLKNAIQRRKLYYMYSTSIVVVLFGILYTSYLYKLIPIPEMMTLTFSRSMVYPLIISIIVIGGVLLKCTVKAQKKAIRNICIIGLFTLAFFPNFKISVLIYIVCIIIAYLFVYHNKKLSIKMKLTPLAAWVYMAVIIFLFIKAGNSTLKSYKLRSPFFPLIVFNLERDHYDCQVWAKENTETDSVFICLIDSYGYLSDNYTFRGFSCRPMLTGDYASFYLNYEFKQEHLKRVEFINNLIQLITQGDNLGIKRIIENAPWKLDYIALPKRFNLPYPQVYFNNTYSCYLVSNRKSN